MPAPSKPRSPAKPKAQPPAASETSGAFAPPVYALQASGQIDRLLDTEWLLTNGLGGFAMGTCAGVPARRYHGLLIAAAKPPVGRVMALSATVDQLELFSAAPFGSAPGTSRELVELSSFRFAGTPSEVHPKGVERLHAFEKSLTARWVCEVSGIRITKELQLFSRVNACAITCTMQRIDKKAASSPAARLNIRPLTALRDFHALTRRAWHDRFDSRSAPDGKGARVALDDRTLYLQSDLAAFEHDPQWWYDFFYAMDARRGQDCREDLYSPGTFRLTLPADRSAVSCTLQASIDPIAILDRSRDLSVKRNTLGKMCASAVRPSGARDGCHGLQPMVPGALSSSAPGAGDSPDQPLTKLITAAADFIVARDAEHASIIAGYPWFADWGRDTSIALPGLLLATGRFDDARKTLLAFASHRRNGIVPNVFNDQTGEPEYNTVDASLWFILGACAYLEKTGDRAAWDGHLAPACLDIVTHYRKGTDFQIAMDPHDKLITAGASATQLTWMDARRDGVTFTPRHGKPVEINALWCSALRTLAAAIASSDATMSANLTDLADAAAKSFRAKFWNAPRSCLFDVLSPNEHGAGWHGVDEIRPNQVFAASLPHSPLSTEEQKAVVKAVREKLLTPFGVRTLDPAHPAFRARYEGNLFERDRAYHNGTAWPWLLGPLAEAAMRTENFSHESKVTARSTLMPIIDQMSGQEGGCLGQIAEIYDATDPQRPQGCPAQAWSVGEILRVYLMTL